MMCPNAIRSDKSKAPSVLLEGDVFRLHYLAGPRWRGAALTLVPQTTGMQPRPIVQRAFRSDRTRCVADIGLARLSDSNGLSVVLATTSGRSRTAVHWAAACPYDIAAPIKG